jgi:hypothetical protein
MKVDNERTTDKKDNKVPANGWRKALKTEKTQYIYKTAEEVIEESKHPGQRKREFKYKYFIYHAHFFYTYVIIYLNVIIELKYNIFNIF